MDQYCIICRSNIRNEFDLIGNRHIANVIDGATVCDKCFSKIKKYMLKLRNDNQKTKAVREIDDYYKNYVEETI